MKYLASRIEPLPAFKKTSGINFQDIINTALPDYLEGKINLKNLDLSIGGIFSALLPFVYIIAGLILFILIIVGGFEMLTSSGDKDKLQSAKSRLTNAVIGFMIIFISYWLIKILEIIFGLKIL